MGNANKSKIIKIFGVTLAKEGGRTRSYGHGRTKIEDVFVDYVDYFIDDLIILIKKQNLEKRFLKGLKEELKGGIKNGMEYKKIRA